MSVPGADRNPSSGTDKRRPRCVDRYAYATHGRCGSRFGRFSGGGWSQMTRRGLIEEETLVPGAKATEVEHRSGVTTTDCMSGLTDAHNVTRMREAHEIIGE